MTEIESKIKIPCEVTAKPSEVVKHHSQIINIDGTSIQLNLVTMKRSFLLVINNIAHDDAIDEDDLSREMMIRGFMQSNNNLKGLSLALGHHNTCIVNSDNSLASVTLASRLSKKLNNDQPVYVANNFICPQDNLESSDYMAKLYMRVFQFVRMHYQCESKVELPPGN